MADQINRPCAKCPFRKDVPVYIRAGRAREIANALRHGGMFPCHETADEESSSVDHKWCAGAVLTMANEGTLDDNQIARISMRLGMLDPSTMRGAELCSASLAAWTRRYRRASPAAQAQGEKE